MKTATEKTKTTVQDMGPKYTIRIAMWKRAGGGVFPSPTQIEALHKQLNQTLPCILQTKD